MPLYEYECESCGLHFEKSQRFSEEPVRFCPNCGGPVHRVIQPVGVIFKGSGFYVTDNRGKSSTMPPTKKDGESKSENGTGSDAPASDAKATPKSSEASSPAA